MGHFPDAKHLSPTVKTPGVWMLPNIQVSATRELKLPHENFGFWSRKAPGVTSGWARSAGECACLGPSPCSGLARQNQRVPGGSGNLKAPVPLHGCQSP